MKNILWTGFCLFLFFWPAGCKEKKETPLEVSPPPASEPQVSPMTLLLTPIEAIRDLDRKVESYKTGPHLTPEEIEADKKLKTEIIRGTFDIHELCKLALDVHWNEISQDQQNAFSQLMTNLLERKAILSKEQVKTTSKPYNIVYKGEKYLNADKSQALVYTQLFVPSEKIDLNIQYKLVKSERGWKIFDVIVDDASLVENYKFQFDTIIRKYGYQELVSRMEKKLKEME